MITYEGTQLSHPKLEPLHNTRFTIYFYQQPADDSYIPVPQIPLFHTLPQLHKLQSAVRNGESNG